MDKEEHPHKVEDVYWQRFYLIIFAVAILNLVDIISTYWLYLHWGASIEGNPLMRRLFIREPRLAVIIKMTMLLVFVAFLPPLASRCFRLAYLGVKLVAWAYTIVLLAHILFIYRCWG